MEIKDITLKKYDDPCPENEVLKGGESYKQWLGHQRLWRKFFIDKFEKDNNYEIVNQSEVVIQKPFNQKGNVIGIINKDFSYGFRISHFIQGVLYTKQDIKNLETDSYYIPTYTNEYEERIVPEVKDLYRLTIKQVKTKDSKEIILLLHSLEQLKDIKAIITDYRKGLAIDIMYYDDINNILYARDSSVVTDYSGGFNKVDINQKYSIISSPLGEYAPLIYTSTNRTQIEFKTTVMRDES